MKIKKGNFAFYYINNKTNSTIFHGLCNDYKYFSGISYRYHNERKGFCLRNEIFL